MSRAARETQALGQLGKRWLAESVITAVVPGFSEGSLILPSKLQNHTEQGVLSRSLLCTAVAGDRD